MVLTWPTTVWTARQTTSQFHTDCWRRAWVDLWTRRLSRRPTVSTRSTRVSRRSHITGPAVNPARWWPIPDRATVVKASSRTVAAWTSLVDRLPEVWTIHSLVVACFLFVLSYILAEWTVDRFSWNFWKGQDSWHWEQLVKCLSRSGTVCDENMNFIHVDHILHWVVLLSAADRWN